MNANPAHWPSDHPHVNFGKVGVLLVNLGTPDGTDYKSMRRYLEEFLTDKRVIEWSRWFWYPILYGIVLNKRPQKVGKAYEEIWNKDLDESYLRTYTRSQAEKLAAALKDLPSVHVDWAMRYGQPAIQAKMNEMQRPAANAFSSIRSTRNMPPRRRRPSTTKPSRRFSRCAGSLHCALSRNTPMIRFTSRHWRTRSTSIGLPRLGAGTRDRVLSRDPEILLHEGRPLSLPVLQDDAPAARASWLGEGEADGNVPVALRPEEWLQPYTDKTVEKLAKDGVKRIAILNPGFVSDCLETLEEIAGEAGEDFLHNGGEKFTHIPCLNDSEDGMRVIENVVRRELQGWI